MNLIIKICIIGFMLCSVSCAQSYEKQEITKEINFLVLADIHFDPFSSCHNKIPCPLIQKLLAASPDHWASMLDQYETPAEANSKDTNWRLLRSSYQAAGNAVRNQHIDFVLLLGDYLGHRYRDQFRRYSIDKSMLAYQNFTKKTLQFLTNLALQVFPNKNIYPVVGNNDSYRGDYYIQAKGLFYSDLVNDWRRLIKNMTPEMQKSIRQGGYYSIDLMRDKSIKLIAINSTFFSYKAYGKNLLPFAEEQLRWFHQQLNEAESNHQKVFIMMHIPMSVDMYLSTRFYLFTILTLWQQDYIERFQAEIKSHASIIAGIFNGHLHSNWYQILTFNDNSKIPVLVTGSISPIFGTSPTFRSYRFSIDSQTIDSYTNYYQSHLDGAWHRETDCHCIF